VRHNVQRRQTQRVTLHGLVLMVIALFLATNKSTKSSAGAPFGGSVVDCCGIRASRPRSAVRAITRKMMMSTHSTSIIGVALMSARGCFLHPR
jgi:hypothetical protein